MFRDDELMLKQADAYAKSKGIRLIVEARLGHGSDGAVWRTNRPSAVKALYDFANYEKELESYHRLASAQTTEIAGFAVPLLKGWDDDLRVIEMSIVQPPYLLDFGKVHLDHPPAYWFDAQLMQNAYAEWRERFGRRWSDVKFAVELLVSRFGIYYVDPRPSNIDTGQDDDDDDDWGEYGDEVL